MGPGSTAAPQAGPRAAPAPSTPADAALRLQALLGQHDVLAADMMRGRLRNDEDFAQSANAAVGQNTDELAQVVATLGGEQRATQFQTLWGEHVTSLFNYSRGLATNDAAVRDEARTALDRFRADGAEFVAEASQGRLTREAVRTELGTHDDHLIQQADAYAAGDFAGRTRSTARGTSTPTPSGTPCLRAAAAGAGGRAEHPGLEAALEDDPAARRARRAGARHAARRRHQRPGLPGDGRVPQRQHRAATAAVSSLFGEPAASQFMELWADHLDLLGGYVADVGAQKENRREEVQAGLRDWQARFASFIETATGGRVPASDLAAALLGLDDLLLGQVDALAAGDYQRARELANQTYPQVYGFARNLADAFGATLAARMPEGGAPTGGGGMAGALVPPAAGFPPAVAPAAAAPASFRSVRTYQEVAPPVRLRIPALRIDTPLQQLGRAADRTVEVPADFGVAGWFVGGPRPGQAGPAVILGHVDSRRGPGVFFPLAGVTPATEVHVDRADGSTVTFRVTGVLTVAKDGFPTEQVYAPTLQSSLRLVTCGGPFDHAAGSYRDNVIVSADPVR